MVVIVDIIIPAYNRKKELHRALSSIACQTKKDKCIVTVVDDCSEENLEEIINSFRPFIKINYVKLKENKKYPGLVRQVGLNMTNAPYVIFLDSDDMLAAQAVELAEREMRSTNADVLIGYFYKQDKNKYILMNEQQTTWLHGNVYKREFLEKNNITFPTGYNEDGAFNTQCYLLSQRTGILKVPISYWMDNEGSITKSVNDFSYVFSADLVNTLKHAYKNVFSKEKISTKCYFNLGTHFGLFHKIITDFFSKDKKNLSEYYDEFLKAIKRMVKELKINTFTSEQKIAFKKGFIKSFLKYPKKDTIPINLFLENVGIKLTIALEDLYRSEESENHNN